MSTDNSVPTSLKFIFGGLSGAGAACCVQPIDLVKKRMQVWLKLLTSFEQNYLKISGEGGNVKLYKNSIHCARTIIKTEGFIGLYNGLSASLARQLSYSTVRTRLTASTRPLRMDIDKSASVEIWVGTCKDFMSSFSLDLELIISCWINFHHMVSLQIFSWKLEWESLQVLLEQFVEHQLMSPLFECVSIIGYPNHIEETILGPGFWIYRQSFRSFFVLTDFQSFTKCFWCLATDYCWRGYHGTLDRMWTNNWPSYGCQCMSTLLSNTSERRNYEQNFIEGRIYFVISWCNDSWIYKLMCLSTNRYCQNKITKYEG